MNGNLCTGAACSLAQNGGLISFPLVTLAGLVDSLNPCAITMIILLLTSLIIFSDKRERVLPTGLIYIISVFMTYLLIGFLFYETFRLINFSPARFWINKILGLVLLAAGLINLKDFFLPEIGPHLEIPQRTRPFLKNLTANVSYPMAALLGFLVTILETPCSLPIYAGTANILSRSGLPSIFILFYFLYYNLLFTLPLWLILFLIWKGSDWRLIELQDWQHKGKRPMKLSLGLLLFLMGIWLVLW